MKGFALRFFLLSGLLFSLNRAQAQISPKEQLIAEINKVFADGKMWDMEALFVDNGGSLKYKVCLSADCNPYVSWDFFIKNVKPVKVGKLDDYVTVDFECNEGADCIIPAGYEKGGRYEMKKALQFIVKDKKVAETAVEKLNRLQQMDLSK